MFKVGDLRRARAPWKVLGSLKNDSSPTLGDPQCTPGQSSQGTTLAEDLALYWISKVNVRYKRALEAKVHAVMGAYGNETSLSHWSWLRPLCSL